MRLVSLEPLFSYVLPHLPGRIEAGKIKVLGAIGKARETANIPTLPSPACGGGFWDLGGGRPGQDAGRFFV